MISINLLNGVPYWDFIGLRPLRLISILHVSVENISKFQSRNSSYFSSSAINCLTNLLGFFQKIG